MIILYDDLSKKAAETKGLAEAVRNITDKDVTSALLQNLEISLQNGKPVEVALGGKSLTQFAPVYFRTISRARDLAAIAAGYLKDNNAIFVDQEALPNVSLGKIYQMYLLHKNDLSIPTTYAGPHEYIRSLLGSKLSYPFIYKANTASKGAHNYLINSLEDFDKVVAENGSKRFIAQSYIANRGDYRFLVFGDSVGLIISRRGDPSTHLNNTSQGAEASLVALEDMDESIKDTAVRAARVMRRDIAGVDIIIDFQGQPQILEVNRTPQLATGTFTDEKLAAFTYYMNSL